VKALGFALVICFILQTSAALADPFTNTVDFQDGNADPNSYGGGYYTSTNTLNGQENCTDGTCSWSTGLGTESISMQGATLESIDWNHDVVMGTVYRNDGYTEWYDQVANCQTNTGPDGYYWTNC
jgi:hypothetical protein